MSETELIRKQVASFLAKAKCSATGWEPVIHDVEALSERQVYLYVADIPTGWVWLATLPLSSYKVLSLRAAAERPAAVQDIRGACAGLIAQAAGGKAIAPIAGLNWEEQLAVAMASYSGTTKVWELADRFSDGGHFVVLHYREQEAAHGLLRPFAIPYESDCPLPPEALLEAVTDVMAIDFKNHPDWIPSGQA